MSFSNFKAKNFSVLPLLVIALLGLTAVFAGPVPANYTSAQSDESEKVPISFEDVIVNGLGARGFSGTWISGNNKKRFIRVNLKE